MSLRQHSFLGQRLPSAPNAVPARDAVRIRQFAYPPYSESYETGFLITCPNGKDPALRLDDGIAVTGLNAILLLLRNALHTYLTTS